MLQEGGAEPCLFGWHLIEPNARRVAIFEGEIDAMTPPDGHCVAVDQRGAAIINGSRTTGNACSSSATSCCATTATKRARARAR